MLKGKNAIQQARLPDYLSFFNEKTAEPVKYHLEAYKTGKYDLKEEEDALNSIQKLLKAGKA